MSTDDRGAFRFVMHSRVEVTDTDLGGIVYYGRYSHFVDRGVLAYRRHLEIPPLGPPGHLFVVRALHVEYLAAARFDEVLGIWVRASDVGRTSHTMRVEVTHHDPGLPTRTLARATVTIVGVAGYDDPRPTRMPPELVDALRAFEGDA